MFNFSIVPRSTNPNGKNLQINTIHQTFPGKYDAEKRMQITKSFTTVLLKSILSPTEWRIIFLGFLLNVHSRSYFALFSYCIQQQRKQKIKYESTTVYKIHNPNIP